jgi:hypothetical protein
MGCSAKKEEVLPIPTGPLKCQSTSVRLPSAYLVLLPSEDWICMKPYSVKCISLYFRGH